jgi:hypothetical protein
MDRGVVASQYDLGSTGYIHNGRRHVVAVRFATVIASAATATLRARLRPLKDTCACAGARDRKAVAPVSSAEKVIRMMVLSFLIDRVFSGRWPNAQLLEMRMLSSDTPANGRSEVGQRGQTIHADAGAGNLQEYVDTIPNPSTSISAQQIRDSSR